MPIVVWPGMVLDEPRVDFKLWKVHFVVTQCLQYLSLDGPALGFLIEGLHPFLLWSCSKQLGIFLGAVYVRAQGKESSFLPISFDLAKSSFANKPYIKHEM